MSSRSQVITFSQVHKKNKQDWVFLAYNKNDLCLILLMLVGEERSRAIEVNMKSRTKYFIIKAFGETLLITIGILLALFINNWNEEKQNKQTENEYIIRIIQELKSDSIDLVEARAELTDLSSDFKKVLDLADKINLDKHSLANLFNNTLRVKTIKLHSDTYEVLKYNGGFNLIKDHDVLFQIVNYYSETTFLDDSNTELMRTFQSHINLLSESGFMIADESNAEELYKLYQTQKARGLLNIRKTYSEILIEEVDRRLEYSQKLSETLIKYLDK